MSRTVYYTATTIDGFIADTGNSLQWLFDADSGGNEDFAPFFETIGAFAMGRTTWEWIVNFEGLTASSKSWSATYGDVPAWVFTNRSLPAIPGVDVRFVRGDVRPVHEAMTAAAGGKDIWLVGGGDLVGQFADAGLLDRLVLGMAPVSLGAGAPLLPRRLESSRLTLTGVRQVHQFAYLSYDVS